MLHEDEAALNEHDTGKRSSTEFVAKPDPPKQDKASGIQSNSPSPSVPQQGQQRLPSTGHPQAAPIARQEPAGSTKVASAKPAGAAPVKTAQTAVQQPRQQQQQHARASRANEINDGPGVVIPNPLFGLAIEYVYVVVDEIITPHDSLNRSPPPPTNPVARQPTKRAPAAEGAVTIANPLFGLSIGYVSS